MKKHLYFSTRINFAMSYKNYTSSELAEELRKKGINVNWVDIRNWILGYSVPPDTVKEIVSEILLDDKKKIYDDDFIGCLMASRKGDKPLTNEQFREIVDHAYELTKNHKNTDTSGSDEEIETFEAVL